jgi:phosphoribosylaminoimidazolecarboxamide formyltransferase/IMP cyclohydrolase
MKKSTDAKKIALISVFNKEGIVEFAGELCALDYTIISSGGTAKVLKEAGIPVTDTADFTGLPAMLDHRVATLHPKIYGGLLAMDTDEHRAELLKAEYEWIDLVCVDFYPLEQAIADPQATPESVRKLTDIGGPTMVRAGAKGLRITICDPKDRPLVIEWIKRGEKDREHFIQALAAKAEFIVARYAAVSSLYLSHGINRAFFGQKDIELRYGENAYQAPACLVNAGSSYPLAIHNFKMHAGNPSMINFTDVDRALTTTLHIAAGCDVNFQSVPYIAVGVKHGNACGAALGETKEEAVVKMLKGNLRSIFGGTVLLNFEITKEIAETLVMGETTNGRRRPLDVVVGSSVADDAIEILKRQNDRCLILTNPALATLSKESLDTTVERRMLSGGDWIEQPKHNFILDLSSTENIARYGKIKRDEKQQDIIDRDTILAWAVCGTSNSNTITLAKEGMIIGNGVGQQDRVEAAELAIKRATDMSHDMTGAVAVSDSFFPFPDAPQKLLDAGVARIFATSGSLNDKLTIALFEDSAVAELVHIPDKVGRMFFGH